MDIQNTVERVLVGDQEFDINSKYWGGLEPQSKQDTLVSGNNIKTINGSSILGDGNIEIVGGNIESVDIGVVMDDVELPYVTKDYVDNLIGDINIVLDNIISGGSENI
jgi:hypothetical protein